jgi:type I restriction enzyme R subunit
MTARTAATEGFTVARGEIDWDALDDATRAELQALFDESDPLTVDPTALERKFTIPERNRAMVREFRQVLENGYTGPNGIRRAPDWGKTIVFAVTKRHAETLARMFDDVFADKKPSPTTRYADFVVSGLGPDDRCGRTGKDQAFQERAIPANPGQREHARHRLRLPGCAQLGNGALHAQLDPEPANARARHAAFAGQGPLHMWDFTGVTLRHGDDETPGEGGAVVVRETVRLQGRPRRMLTLDVRDEIDPATREWVTIDETGHAFMDLDEARAEALGAAFETWLSGEQFNSDQLRLLHLIKEQIKANAADLTLFESRRFDAPPLSMNGGFERARAVVGGEAELEQTLSAMNTAVFGIASPAAPGGDPSRPDNTPH